MKELEEIRGKCSVLYNKALAEQNEENIEIYGELSAFLNNDMCFLNISIEAALNILMELGYDIETAYTLYNDELMNPNNYISPRK